jgi:hypothetical protein
LIVNRLEALSLPGCLDALHHTLAPSGGRIADFWSVVQTLMWGILHTGHHSCHYSGIAGQFVRHHHPWSGSPLSKQLAQQALGDLRAATALDQDVERRPMLIHRSL